MRSVLVGTRKGAFILTSDGKREKWEISGPHFAGWELYHLKGSPADPNRRVAPIDVRDLAEWTIRMAEQRTTGVFNAAGPASPITMREMLDGIARGIQVVPALVWAQVDFLKANNVSAWRDMPVWVPARGETAGFAKRSIAKALAAGLTFRPLNATASDTLAWFKQQPAERQAKLKAGLTPAREAEVLSKWKAKVGAG